MKLCFHLKLGISTALSCSGIQNEFARIAVKEKSSKCDCGKYLHKLRHFNQWKDDSAVFKEIQIQAIPELSLLNLDYGKKGDFRAH